MRERLAQRRPSSARKNGSSSPQTIRTGPVNWPNRLAASSRTRGWTCRANLARSRRMARLDRGSIQLAVRSGSSGLAGQRPEGERAVPDSFGPQRRGHARHQPGMAQRAEQRRERPGREGAERVAVGQHRGADPAGVAAEQDLADRAAGVVADDGHVAEAECRDEVRTSWATPAARGRRRRSSAAGARRAGASARSCGCPRPRGGRPLVPRAGRRRGARARTRRAGGSSSPGRRRGSQPALRQVGHREAGGGVIGSHEK